MSIQGYFNDEAFNLAISASKRLSDLYFAQDKFYKNQIYCIVIRTFLDIHTPFNDLAEKGRQLLCEDIISEIEYVFQNDNDYISIDKLN